MAAIKPVKSAVLKPMETAVIKPPVSGTLTKPMVRPAELLSNPTINNAQPINSPQPMSTTPGGLNGTINNHRYDRTTPDFNNSQYGGGNGGHSSYSGGGGRVGAQRQHNNNFGNFDQFRDSALEQAMRGLNPRIDQQNAQFEQMMVARGIQPGTAQYDAQRANLDRRNNDLLTQAQYGAQQQGLAAQNQAWNQDYQYDALANALNQTQIGANASMANARTAADASRYASDNSANTARYNADLANALGYARLNENGRQFDVNDIFRNQQLDLQGALGFGNLDLGQQRQDLNVFNSNQNAQNQWWNQAGSLAGNAPGVNFQPTGGLVGNSIQAGQNAANAQAQQNSVLGSLLGAGLSMLPFSDKRLKENIEFVDNVDGINVYEFDYKDKALGKERYRGVMAQEIANIIPNAIKWLHGYMTVDYDQLPIDMEIV